MSPEEEQSRDINTDSDVDSMKEPDWQKSLIAVTTEKEEDSGMTESRVSKAKLVASMSSSKVSPLRDLSTNWTGMRWRPDGEGRGGGAGPRRVRGARSVRQALALSADTADRGRL